MWRASGCLLPSPATLCSGINNMGGCLGVQGPPGTGKTSTIVALASALLGLPPQEGPAASSKAPKGPKEASLSPRRILVCAQSNAAVDELTLRLSKSVLDKDSGTVRYLPAPSLLLRGSHHVEHSVPVPTALTLTSVINVSAEVLQRDCNWQCLV